MSIKKAYNILKWNNITFKDYFDLIGLDCRQNLKLHSAIERVKTFISTGY